MKDDKQLIMIGPDPEGLGGISRVVKILEKGNLFRDCRIKYIPSVSDTSGNRLIFLIKSLIKFVFSCGKSCRGVYIHTASNNSFYRKSLFMIAAIILRKKIILHIHPSYFIIFLSQFKGLEKKFFLSLLGRVDFFVVLTQQMRKDMIRFFPNKRVHILKNPVDLKAMTNKNGIVRAKNRLLYLGWYNKPKGVYELVDALQILLESGEKIRMDFYGTKEVDRLRSYVEERGLTNNVKVNGWIDDQDKVEAFYKSTMLILPSHSEGIPNVILEAMATKTPIVSTLAGGLKEILKDGGNAIIAKSKNPLDLSQKIEKCLKNDDLRKKIAENAYMELKEKYDFPIIKKEFAKIMENI